MSSSGICKLCNTVLMPNGQCYNGCPQQNIRTYATDNTQNKCNHIIVDARNEVIKSGYICIKCYQMFEAGDH